MPHYKVLCGLTEEDAHTFEGGQRLVFASRSKVFTSKTSAEAYASGIASNRKAEVWTCDQIRAALWLAAKCRCHECQYCQISRDYWSNPKRVRLEFPEEVQLCLVSP